MPPIFKAPAIISLNLWLKLLASMALAPFMTVTADEIPDPTKPVSPSEFRSGEEASEESRFHVESILIASERRIAIINGERVQAGDQIGGATVESINTGSVELETSDGPLTLKLLDIHETPKDTNGGSGDQRERSSDKSGWSKVNSWSGNGSKTTGTFNVDSQEWRISWNIEPHQNDMEFAFLIFVYTRAGDLASQITTSNPGSDTSYLHSGPGEHYLEIHGGVDWSVTIQDKGS